MLINLVVTKTMQLAYREGTETTPSHLQTLVKAAPFELVNDLGLELVAKRQ